MLIERPGFYGKLPGKGDFIRRNLPNDMVTSWDQWLQAAIEYSQAVLEDSWLRHYLVSPIWRFALSPGLLSTHPITGVMMPSVDSVGRHFPLTLAQALAIETNIVDFASQADNWFERMEDAALYALSSDFDMLAFEQQLEAIPAPALAKPASPIGNSLQGWTLDTHSGAELVRGSIVTQMQSVLENQYPGFSIWWSLGSEDIEPVFLLYQGLPPPEAFSAFITGRW
ncbi:type VI secretion system-associated protein TagF [Bowmanella sp. Y26]|uniref:type VI secretion system-associated protein TagF n=1 Tax=Bowmanella yangjiangensis TaxID=2811230 RepID=UPI001BDBB911|nr:type VI secretion system-associated protein TagF [Bowmanella yangjiangensis]MBT1063903.1 type VI secretion system-associated protein TagF [Bowmanella yangjiangensis]